MEALINLQKLLKAIKEHQTEGILQRFLNKTLRSVSSAFAGDMHSQLKQCLPKYVLRWPDNALQSDREAVNS